MLPVQHVMCGACIHAGVWPRTMARRWVSASGAARCQRCTSSHMARRFFLRLRFFFFCLFVHDFLQCVICLDHPRTQLGEQSRRKGERASE